MSEEWGPWIEHDGKGCPCVGEWVECICAFTLPERYSWRWTGVALDVADQAAWDWKNMGKHHHSNPRLVVGRVIRYRIRRPKGMATLLANLATIPTDLDTDVPVEVLNPELAE